MNKVKNNPAYPINIYIILFKGGEITHITNGFWQFIPKDRAHESESGTNSPQIKTRI